MTAVRTPRFPRPPARPNPMALAVAATLLSGAAAAQSDRYWNCSGTQSWTANCWVDMLGNPAAAPAAGAYAILKNPGSGSRAVNLSTAIPSLGALSIGTAGSGTMTLNVLAGATLRSNGTSLGTQGLASSNIHQSGGLHETPTLWMSIDPSALSFYSLSGGNLATQNTTVGYWNNASFAHTGGTHTTSTLALSRSEGTAASYALSGTGLLQTGGVRLSTAYANSTSNFNQTGGRHDADEVHASAGGTYNLSGNGQLNAQWILLGAGTNNYAGGRFVQSGGTSNISQSVMLKDGGKFTLSGTGSANHAAVQIADGSFEQLAGTHTVAAALTLADGGLYRQAGGTASAGSVLLTGPVDGAQLQLQGGQFTVGATLTSDSGPAAGVALSNGTLSTAQTVVGGTRTGRFDHSGGLHQAASLVLGDTAAGNGSYTLSGGTLASAGSMIGQAGLGSFVQTAGDHQAALLTLGGAAGGSGSYLLQGGTLSAGTVRIGGAGNGSFVQQAGTHQVSQSLKIDAGGHYALQGGLLDLGSLDAQVATGGTLQLAGGQIAGQRLKVDGTLHVSGDSTVVAPIDLGARSLAQVDATLALQGTMTLRTNLAHEQGVIGSGLISIGSPGRLTGQGVVAVNLSNAGLVQAKGGALTLAGPSLVNAGTLRNEVGATLFVGAASVQNSGRLQVGAAGGMVFDSALNATAGSLIELSGGTLATPALNHADGARLSGFGTVVGDVANAGEIEFYGPSVVVGGFHNGKGGLLTVRNEQTLVTGLFVNDGTIRTIGGQVIFEGGLVNNGGYFSDPSVNTFSGLVVGTGGWLDAEGGDRFVLSGDFLNHSERADAWDTSAARLVFTGPGERGFHLAGADVGTSSLGLAGNFAWAALEIEAGTALTLHDGNHDLGAALYVGVLTGAQVTGDSVTNLRGNGFNVYYDPAAVANAYLGGRDYRLQDGGSLLALAPVPEPGTHALWLAGVGMLGWRMRQLRERRA